MRLPEYPYTESLMWKNICAVAALAFAAACSDAPTALFSENTQPGRIEVEAVEPEVMEGAATELVVRMLDRTGREMTNLPHWAQPVWESSDGSIFTVEDGVAQTTAPGLAIARVEVAGKTAETELRVNAERIEDIQLSLDGLYLNQSVQRYDGSIPLVEGRSGVLRAFLQANYPNRFTPPPARIDLYMDGSLVSSEMVSARVDEIPFRPDESWYGTSWNAFVPASLARNGLSVQIEVDPDNTMPGLQNRPLIFPAEGPRELRFRRLPEFRARFIPIDQRGIDLRGQVSESTAPSFMDDFLASFPISEFSYDLGEPLITSVTGRDGESWNEILRELTVRRMSEDGDRYYYGVMGTVSGPGIAGMAWLRYPAAIGVDAQRIRSYVYAHEVGHNFSRQHAPCGEPGGIDPDYPHGRGVVGHFGYDPRTRALIPDGYMDLMGYCLNNYWVSDYTYEGVLHAHMLRGSTWNPPSPFVSSSAETETLLVWGGIRNGQPYLDPSFEMTTRPVMPSGRGSAILAGYAADGSELFRYRFEPLELGHGELDHRSFAFALPVTEISLDRLDRLELRSGERRARLSDAMVRSARDRGVQPDLEAHAAEVAPQVVRSGGRTTIRWDGGVSRAALVRNPETGTVISIVRGDQIELPAAMEGADIDFSTGIRSVRMQITDNR